MPRKRYRYVDQMKNRNDWVRFQTAFFGLAEAFIREVGVKKLSLAGGIASVVLLLWLRDWQLFEQTVFFTFIIVAFELMNSAVEELADYVQPEKAEAIKRAKDAAAGAVLTVTIAAIVYTLFDVMRIVMVWW